MNRITAYLDGKTLLVTGATGFLGQPLVEKILWSAPGVRRIHVLIRPKRQSAGVVLSAQDRLERELFESSVFDRLRGTYGEEFLPFLRQKLVAVAGDISQENLGVEAETLRQLRDSVDVVINSAAVVSFDAPLDDALQLNVLGAKRVAEFAAACRDAILVHVSTAYVAGATHRIATETIYHTAAPGETSPFPRGQFSEVDRDLEHIETIIARCVGQSRDPKVERELTRVLLERSRSSRNGKKGGRRKALESLRKKWLENRLTAEGMRWARLRGWNDTYTYTKALGEQMVVRARGEMPTVIVRPSVIESSLSEPIPGWLDGLRMADPLIAAIGKGRLRALPLKPHVNLDLVPADVVVNALLATLPQIAADGGLRCYQVATTSRNPITLGKLYDLIYRYFVKNPMLDKSGQPIRIKYLAFPNRALFRLQHRLRAMPLARAERWLERVSWIKGASKMRRRVAATRAAHQKLYYYGEIYEPYLNIECRFEVDETMGLWDSLTEEEKSQFHFDVERLNWRHYIQNVHIPGIKKYILKLEGGAGRLEAEPADRVTTIPELLARSAALHGAKTALQMRRDGVMEQISFTDLHAGAERLAAQFRRMGLVPGDRVVLFSENQPQWGLAYLGAVSAGLVVVPLDAQTWQREVWSVVRFTEARCLLVSEHCLKRLTPESLLENERAPHPVCLLDVTHACAPHALEAYPRSTALGPEPIQGSGTVAAGWTASPDDPVSIIFTTGTASDPKGAVHTHRSFLANVFGVTRYIQLHETDRLLSVLPLYHALEFSCGFLAPLLAGATVTYTGFLKPKMILETMRDTGTTIMLGVPTLYALIRDDIERRILKAAKPGLKSNWMATSKQLSRSLEERFGMKLGRQLFASVHAEFGDRIRFFVSGGSALGPELYEDFKALGLPIYEGYGLTETAPVLTVNPMAHSKSGSVGKPLPGVELRLSRPDRDGIGEIVVRTPSLMSGYYKNPKATSAALRDGWFHTGDLGWVDEDGYVYISGRIKDVIVTGAGKNVYPADLEAIYAGIPGIEELCVLGVKSGLTEDVHAIVVTDAVWRGERDRSTEKKDLQRHIQALSRELPSYHRLQYVHVRHEPLLRTPAGGIDRTALRAELENRLEAREPVRVATATAPADVPQEDLVLEELARLAKVPAGEIRPESDLYTDLGLDSLEALEMLLFVEAQFGVQVSDDRAEAVRTVGDLLHEIQSQPAVAAARAVLPSELPYTQRSPLDRTLLRLSLSSLQALYRSFFHLRLPDSNGHFPPSGPYIIAANHSSHLDVGAIMAALTTAAGRPHAQRLHVLGAKDYFFDKKLKSWFFSRFFNVVPIRREQTGLDGLRTAKAILSNGEPVLIFPEATRSRTGRMQAFKPGLGLLAFESNVPVIPAYIEGTYEALPAGRFLPKSSPVQVRFGAPIHMERYRTDGGAPPRDELYRQIAQDVRRNIEDLAGDRGA